MTEEEKELTPIEKARAAKAEKVKLKKLEEEQEEELVTEFIEEDQDPLTEGKPLQLMNPLSGVELFESPPGIQSRIHDNMWLAICGRCEFRYSHRTDREIEYSDGNHYSKCSHCNALNRVPEPIEEAVQQQS